MDIRDQRDQAVRPAAAPAGTQNTAPAASVRDSGSGRKNKRYNGNKMWRIAVVAAVVAVAVLICAVIALTVSSNSVKPEDKYVFSGKLQAVFLNNGQVYFGHIGSLNPRYLTITDVYYLKTSSPSGSSTTDTSSSNAANTTISLVKLGCELHEPYDQIIINRDQVTFWENLQSDGQVAKAVATYQKQNPDGQKCSDQSSSASTNGTSTTQNTTTPSTTKP